MNAISIYPVSHEALDECRPLPVVARWCHIATVLEDRRPARCQGLGHEAELDERLHPNRQQEVEDAVGVQERVEQPSSSPDERAHIIGKQAVEPYVSEAQRFVTLPELGLPIRPKRQRGMTTAHGVLPAMRQRGSSLG